MLLLSKDTKKTAHQLLLHLSADVFMSLTIFSIFYFQNKTKKYIPCVLVFCVAACLVGLDVSCLLGAGLGPDDFPAVLTGVEGDVETF